MKKVTVSLKSVEAVSLFVRHTEGFEDISVDASQGNYTVDAKAIVSMLNLTLSTPIQLSICGGDEDTERYLRVIDAEGFIKDV
jgi:hypothetical protein